MKVHSSGPSSAQWRIWSEFQIGHDKAPPLLTPEYHLIDGDQQKMV